jgi:hypothetical protein
MSRAAGSLRSVQRHGIAVEGRLTVVEKRRATSAPEPVQDVTDDWERTVLQYVGLTSIVRLVNVTAKRQHLRIVREIRDVPRTSMTIRSEMACMLTESQGIVTLDALTFPAQMC